LAAGFKGAPTATLAAEILALGAASGRLFASHSVSGYGIIEYTLWCEVEQRRANEAIAPEAGSAYFRTRGVLTQTR